MVLDHVASEFLSLMGCYFFLSTVNKEIQADRQIYDCYESWAVIHIFILSLRFLQDAESTVANFQQILFNLFCFTFSGVSYHLN